jgi:uncharacterized membrane protein
MPWTHSPVKLFGTTAFLLFLVRLLFPPADFAGALQAHSYIHLSSIRLDFTGYGLFEFAASVFLLCALVYYTTERLTSRVPSAIVIGLHFWPSLLFAVFSIFLARSVNHIRAAELSNPVIRASINDWLVAFTYALVAFIALQIVFLNLAIRSIWSNRKGRQPAVSGVIRRSHS